jgi:Uma2 family endonuclease
MAAMRGVNRKVGFSDLQHLPDDGPRYELYDGEVYMVPAPIPRHQRVVRHILVALHEYATAHGGEVLDSPIDVVFSEYDVLQPDLLFFTASRQHFIQPDQAIRVPPDLAVEVLSPATAHHDRGRKLATYDRYGVAEYWIVDPVSRRVDVYRRQDSAQLKADTATVEDILRSPLLPGLELKVAQFFGD